VPYVSIEHQPGVWVAAHIEKQWKHQGCWRLSCYYFVDLLQYYRVFDADQVRPVEVDIRQPDVVEPRQALSP
jgi:hypothetical protein